MKYGVINENHLFVKCYNKGKKIITKRVVVFVLDDKHSRFLQKSHPEKKKINRVGISVTKKLGNAVVRNRAKRVIREAWRKVTKTYELKNSKLIVITAEEDEESSEISTLLNREFLLAKAKKQNRKATKSGRSVFV